MPFDMPLDVARRSDRGRVSYLSGLAAENAVEQRYLRAGHRVAARRWRGAGAEIDLVVETADGLILVEVKSARTHRDAWESFHLGQFQRICAASEAYAAAKGGPAVPMRLDLALVDGQGQIEIMENFIY